MTIDPELVNRARTAATNLAAAEHAALESRTAYHTAIRRLHLAGGSLREIAQALSLSHQRVQQIVSAAGGSWWQRVWRSRKIGPDAACTWCGRAAADVAKLIAGPNVYICDVCVHAAERAAMREPRGAGDFALAEKKTVSARCAFCSQKSGHERALIAAPPGHLCTECLRICGEILSASS
jgi:ClpX C4-type zinc finger